MLNVLRQLAVAGALILPIAGCGGDGDCSVPHGTYDVSVPANSGTCPAAFVDAIKSQFAAEPAVIDGTDNDDACEAKSLDSTDTSDGCTTTITGNATASGDGLGDAQLSVAISCTDGSINCAHNFTLRFTRR